MLKNNVQNNLDNAQRIRADLDQQEGRADSLAGQIGQRQERLAEIEDKLTRMREELRGKSEQAQEAAQSAGTLARELEELRQKEAMETATAAEAKALLSALAAAAQEVLDRDEAVRQELRELEQPAGGGARRPASGPEGPGQGGGGAGRGAERHQRLRPAPGVTPEEGGAGPGAPYEAPDGGECPVIPDQDAHRDGEAPRGLLQGGQAGDGGGPAGQASSISTVRWPTC